MKRYFTFYGDIYYPGVGMDNFIGDFETIEDAKIKLNKEHLKVNPQDKDGNWEWRWGVVWDSVDRKDVYSI